MTYQSVINRDYKCLAEKDTRRRGWLSPHWFLLLVGVGTGALLFGYASDDAEATRDLALASTVSGVMAGGPPAATAATAALHRSLDIPATVPTPPPSDAIGVAHPNREVHAADETRALPPAGDALATADDFDDTTEQAPLAAEDTVALLSAEEAIAVADDFADEAAQHTIPADASCSQVTVRSGDSLARLFSNQGLDAKDLQRIITLGGEAKKLARIHPGDTLEFCRDDAGQLLELIYTEDELHGLSFRRSGNGFVIKAVERQPERRTASANAVIDSSLFLAAQKAQLSDNLTMQLAGIFGWDIDFALDIRKGDSFNVLYEELYLDGQKIDDGKILAAEFINDGKVYRAVRYQDAKGRTDYYSPSGTSMRKTFLRTPVAFSRISSGFSLGRKHPVLNRIRAHKGVDYAAPQGTPVKATANGKIIFRGRKGGYGNVVILQHGSSHSTLYAHLSRFVRGQADGSRVRQGQVIGYVGKTGLATGPHLHYEFRVNGVHRNPLTVKFPMAAPLDQEFMADFEAHSQSLLAQLEQMRTDATQVALNKSEE